MNTRLPLGRIAQAVCGLSMVPAWISHEFTWRRRWRPPGTTDWRLTVFPRDVQPTGVKWPPMNTVSPSAAMANERTVSLAFGFQTGPVRRASDRRHVAPDDSAHRGERAADVDPARPHEDRVHLAGPLGATNPAASRAGPPCLTAPKFLSRRPRPGCRSRRPCTASSRRATRPARARPAPCRTRATARAPTATGAPVVMSIAARPFAALCWVPSGETTLVNLPADEQRVPGAGQGEHLAVRLPGAGVGVPRSGRRQRSAQRRARRSR